MNVPACSNTERTLRHAALLEDDQAGTPPRTSTREVQRSVGWASQRRTNRARVMPGRCGQPRPVREGPAPVVAVPLAAKKLKADEPIAAPKGANRCPLPLLPANEQLLRGQRRGQQRPLLPLPGAALLTQLRPLRRSAVGKGDAPLWQYSWRLQKFRVSARRGGLV